MKTNDFYLPDSIRTHFAGLGYHYLDERYPDFGGIVIYLQRQDGEQEAAYYISKPSTIELFTSDELRQLLDFLEEGGIRLQHVVTTAPVSAGSRKLAAETGVILWELQYRYVEIARPIINESRVKRLLFPLRMIFANSASRPR